MLQLDNCINLRLKRVPPPRCCCLVHPRFSIRRVTGVTIVAADGVRLGMDLLDHDGLMTPVLVAQFGPIRVEKSQDDRDGGLLHRVSRLHQMATGWVILDADMILNTRALPPKVLTGLHETTTPFGHLLIESDVQARSVDRVITRVAATDGGEDRLKRQHRLIDARRGVTLCQVIETLSPESLLQDANAAWKKERGID